MTFQPGLSVSRASKTMWVVGISGPGRVWGSLEPGLQSLPFKHPLCPSLGSWFVLVRSSLIPLGRAPNTRTPCLSREVWAA